MEIPLMKNDLALVSAYKEIWQGRSSVQSIDSLEMIHQAIISELKDELAHPRARRNLNEKLVIAFERIDKSSLSYVEKKNLKALYMEKSRQINKGVNPVLDEI
jgi:hypothetical protein